MKTSASAQNKTEANAANKPTILDIINETEKNQTLMQQGTTRLPPSPIIPVQGTARMGESSKAISHSDIPVGHAGIAEPLTWQQLENEMTVNQKAKETSTSKDGISTWILLSGSEKQQPSATPASTTIVGQVDKIEIKETATDRHNVRFEEIHQDKLAKPTKHHEIIEQKRGRPEKKNKPSITPLPNTSGIIQASDFAADGKLAQRRKHPINNAKQNKRKPTPTTTTTTTTEASVATTDKLEGEYTIFEKADSTEAATTPTTPIPFVILEPKDADFDLPQDRAPPTKKPKRTNSKVKRKPNKGNKHTSLTKPGKDKPISTKIYSYLSREVLPTVGVGLMGLVVTAGIASYFLGPFAPLRRSYDDALDRQDNADNIYSVNSEEYAGDNADGGQKEEEIFGKFIAGMPANYVPRYVKYYRPDQQYPNHQYNPNMPQRRVYGQGPQGQKFNPYIRYRNDNGFQKVAPSPHFNPMQYHPQHTALRNHQAQPQQPLSPVYDPQYHEVQKQKSFASNMESFLKQQNTGYAADINGKSIANDIMAEDPSKQQETEPVTESATVEETPQIQKRTNTYVVGSAISDIQPSEAIVSASMTASVDGALPSEAVEPVVTVTAASHGPRRRRRREAIEKAQVVDITPETSTPSQTTTETPSKVDAKAPAVEASSYPTRIYNQTDVQLLDDEFAHLKQKLNAYSSKDSNLELENKIQKKIQTEFNSVEEDLSALKKAVVATKDIEIFQKQMRIRAKNYELSVTLKTGITHIRQRIKLLTDLLEHPDDDRIIQKINRRDGNVMTNTTTSSSDISTDTSIGHAEEPENGFIGFLKLLQLKAQFGLNLLQNIKPSFERAFEEVFKRPLQEQ